MKTERTASVWAILLLLLFVPARNVGAQEGKTRPSIVPLEGGGFVALTTETVPASSQELSFSSLEVESNVIHRVLVDKEGGFFFGYDLVVEPVVASKRFKVTVRPLTPEFEQQLRARKTFQASRVHPNFNVNALSRSTASAQVVADGDTFALDVLVNPRTGVKIVDVVRVSFDEFQLREAPVSNQPPRDFMLLDVELKVSNYRLLINGELVAGAKPTGGYAGPLLWFHLPDRGRFIFSLMPHPGYDFKKVGVIEHNKISFTWEGDRYEWISSSPVIGTGGNWNLWVLYDPEFRFDLYPSETERRSAQVKKTEKPETGPLHRMRPKDRTNGDAPTDLNKRVRILIGSADRMENLLPK